MPSPTPNKGYTYPAHGGAVNSWDTPLNTDFDTIDANLGGNYLITVGSSIVGTTFNSTGALVNNLVTPITLPAANAVNLNYTFTGTLGVNTNLVFPSAGGIYDITNSATGAFTLTAKTAAGTGVVINQGGSNLVTCDGINISYSNSNQGKAQVYTYLGNPNTNVAGNVATVNGGVTDIVWDQTDQKLFVATTQGTAATTVWTPYTLGLIPQGYLTLTSATNPVMLADTLAQTTLYYTPYVGNWTVLSNGTNLVVGTTTYPYQFSQMALFLTATQAANTLYDVFMYANPTAGIISPVIGTGVAWGNSTLGSCTRVGGVDLQKLNGVWVNAATCAFTYNPTGAGNTTVNVLTGGLIYLGTIFVDAVAGKISCYRSCGNNFSASIGRKWGVWNCYNRMPVCLQVTDNTASWVTNPVLRAINNNVANSAAVLMGLQEETVDGQFSEFGTLGTSAGFRCGIGVNTTGAITGMHGLLEDIGSINVLANPVARMNAILPLGANLLSALEQTIGNNATINGTQSLCQMTINYRA